MGTEQKWSLNSLENDPNYIAYKAALEHGDFNQLAPTDWVAFSDGKFVDSASSREELFKKLREGKKDALLVTQVKREPIKLHGIFADPEGNLHRGVPTWVVDKNGDEIPVYFELGTRTVYPREEKPASK